MKSIYTYGGQYAQRHLTVDCLFKHKAAGKRLTQVTAFDAEEAAVAAEQQIDTLTVDCDQVEPIRAAAPNIFVTAAQYMRQHVTEDEALGGAIDAMVKGADAIYSPRGLSTVERIAREGISVQGHTGLFPARATQFGGLRTIGKTAQEALGLLDDFRRLEEAGAYCAEVECVAEEALAEIKKHSKLILVTIGAGSSGDIIRSYMSDLSGDTEDPPRHARAFGDVGSIRKALRAERARALAGYRAAVLDGSFPDATTSIAMPPEELEKVKEGLQKLRPLHQ
ncbi:3-methyl-2-oxobutanoate hydroxymethyltransferase [uncultured Roseobacter sp.]|uniref:3-methyl-2-oxobutanoate hydroxymethyltransferase n=1 Tax=uncultured Roseobacter sp. TaxID=114847 RepID=UPI00262FFAFE|nr:3-methyl-2-oxobutanoate hydroxymethyltransferase [uncultured Roseobacter sp.]